MLIRHLRYFTGALVLLSFSILLHQSIGFAEVTDTTIATFYNEPIDGHNFEPTRKFLFPPISAQYKQIIMLYQLSCPEGGCDPWDRIASVRVKSTVNGKHQETEIARVATPYGRNCTLAIDVTDYRSLLADSVLLTDYINTYTGGGVGWLSTISFRFIAGTPDIEAYKVVNLWRGRPVYGDPNEPIDTFLVPIALPFDPKADFSKIRLAVTGHGQGNTDNAAEFAMKTHTLVVGGNQLNHVVWRDNCEQTPCSPQYGSWRNARAGFCPGSEVIPWDSDITAMIKPDQATPLEYKIQPYINNCRPGAEHPDCADPNYNALNHARPFLWIESQIIYYRIPKDPRNLFEKYFDLVKDEKSNLRLKSKVISPEEINIYVYDATGKEMLHEVRHTSLNDQFSLELSTTPGVYLLKILKGKDILRKRIVVG